MWIYRQIGQLITPQGEPAAHGFYSGFGVHANVPADEHIVGQGPIPRGNYAMGSMVTNTHMGPVAIHLVPDDATRAYILDIRPGSDPDTFYIHDDTAIHNHTASEGCIVSISGSEPVMSIWDSSDHDLQVQ
jgi:hypothetical protein